MSDEQLLELSAELELRAGRRREVECRLIRWGEIGQIASGFESFERGAFAGVDPRRVVLRNQHSTVVGKGLELREDDEGAVMVFRISETPAGDEALTLVEDQVLTGVSVGFLPVAGGDVITRHEGRRHVIRRRVDLREASVTFLPTYASARVLATRSQEGSPMNEPTTEPTPATEPTPTPTPAPAGTVTVTGTPAPAAVDPQLITREIERVLEERARRQINPPSPHAPSRSTAQLAGAWASVALRSISGERVPELEIRALADLITDDNLGVVPDAILGELVDPITRARPFLESTRRLPTPESGMNLLVPRIDTRPTAGNQATEKTEVTSTATAISTDEYPFLTYAGAGDISIQLLRRSSPSFLSLYLELLAEAYANATEAAGVAALAAATISAGTGVIDPEALAVGEAYTNAFTNWSKRAPDTMWMSPAAVAAFIDAKAADGAIPLYSELAPVISAAGVSSGGLISGLRPVAVPALAATAFDVIVGPSRAFAWSEDGTFTLQADVPARLGRDVALAGMVAFAPLAPLAFTGWSLTI